MDNTLVPGRIDIVVFANGGWEKIGQIASDPVIAPDDVLPGILEFVATKQNLAAPEKFTGYYSVKNDKISIHWANYAGEIPVEMPTIEAPDIDSIIEQQRQMAMGDAQNE